MPADDTALPDEVTPQRIQARAPKVTKTKPTRRLEPGDLVCGQCGEGNQPTRKFCSRCGNQLGDAQVVRTPWHRRLMFWKRTKRLEAGTRPGQKGVRRDARTRVSGSYRKIRRSLAALTLLLGMVYLAVPPVRGAINRSLANPTAGIRSSVGQLWHNLTYPYDDVPVERSSASSELRRHPSSDAVDGNTVTYWGARWDGKRRPVLRVRFEDSQTIAAIVVHNGASGEDAAKYLQPKELKFEYGDGRIEHVTLKSSGDSQTLKLEGGSTIRRIDMKVRSVYEKADLNRVAIAEIEFKTRK